MASRKKPNSTGAPPGQAKPPAGSTSPTALPEGQGLIPTRPSAATTSKPVGGTVGRAVTARPPARIELSGVAIKKVFDNLAAVVGKVVAAADPAVALPSRLLGSLQEPDSSPGLGLQIEILPPATAAADGNAVLGTSGSKVIATGLTDAAGNFTIPLPAGVMLPPGASLSLRVRGAATDAVSVFSITPDLLGPTGYIGTMKLDRQLAPIPAELFAELQQTIDKDSGEGGAGPTVPKLTLGDDADCIRVLENQTSFERFPYGIFFQLIAPKLYAENETIDGQSTGTFNNVVRVDTLIDRMDLSGPISIDEFRESLLRNPAIVGSLGLGYVLRCGQNWQFQGLALGDLVYSLPLAPGEQQQVVVEEQSTTLTVREFDSVIASDTSSASQVSDASSRATFDSALRQSAQGGSSFTSASESGSISAGGGLLGLLGGPSGSLGETVSGGTTHNWMDGLQNYGSTATQATQTYAEQQAHSFRSAQRTAMRMASTTESTSVTTKTITNHNKLHALTMQYFEVLRQFDITTSYDGVSLVCLVPLDIVWFLPPGQKEHLDDLISNSDLSNAIQWSSQINSAVGGMIGIVSQALSVMNLPFAGAAMALSLAQAADQQLKAAINQVNQLAGLLGGLGTGFAVQATEANQIQSMFAQAKTSLESFSGTQANLLQNCLTSLQSTAAVAQALYQQLSSSALTGGMSRHDVLNRYAGVLAHSDVLARWLPAQYTTGLTRLERFAADPRASLALDSLAEDVIRLSATATVLPFDHLYVSAVTRWGSRLGPVEMIPSAPVTVPGQFDSSQALKTDADLIQYLQGQRKPGQGGGASLQASIALPRALAPTDVVGFEITHSIDSFTYQFPTPIDIATALLGAAASTWPAPVLGIVPALISPPVAPQAKTYAAALLGKEIGAPYLWNFRADLTASVAGNPESYVKPDSNPVELPGGVYPIPAMEVAPLLKFSDLLQIENTLQHVLRNLVRYSKAVWSSLTAEERVMLLQPYLLSLPGLSSTVPLLDCVGNEVLGFYGNSMIMPFSIPQALGDVKGWGMTTGQMEDSLLRFHRQGAPSKVAHASLPTRGVLGEAMLGHCASGEKIDLTRFWNWQDSPTESAPAIATVSVPGSQAATLAAAQVGGQLGSMLPSLINNNVAPAAPTPNTALAQGLISALAAMKGLDPALSGADKLAALIQSTQSTADSARADLVKANTQVTSQALSTLGTILAAPSGSGGGGGGGKGGGGKSGDGSSGSSGGSDSSGGGSNAGEIISAVLPLIIAALA